MECIRGGRSNIGQLPLNICKKLLALRPYLAAYAVSHTLLKRLQAFKGDLKLIGVSKLGWVVENVDAQKRYDRHLDDDGGFW